MNVSKGDAVTYVALVTAAVLQAAEPWRKEAATPPDLHPVLSSPIWAYVPLALLTLVFAIWLFRQLKPLHKDAPANPGDGSQSPQTVISEQRASPPYLKEANVYAGSPTSSPELFPNAVVCFGRSGRDADVCVDFSYFAGGPWTQRRRLLLKNIPSFRRDERLAVTILTRDMDEGGLIWRWGDGQIKYPNRAEGALRPNMHFQCRIAFIFADETEEYAYFIVETGESANSMPVVIGQHMFAFVSQWDAE
jgi:hypothetical protein